MTRAIPVREGRWGRRRTARFVRLLRECLAFAVAVARFSGRSGAVAAMLVAAGAALEGVGVLLLVPLLALLFDAQAVDGSVQGRLSGLLSAGLAPLPRLALLLAMFGALMAIRALVLWHRDALLGRLQMGFVAERRAVLARRLGAASWPVLARLGHGRVQHLLGGDIQRIGAGVQFLFQIGAAAVVLACQAAAAFLLSPKLALIALGLTLLCALAMSTMLRKSSDIGRLLTQTNLSLVSSVTQFLSGIKVAMSQNMQRHFVARFERELAISADQQTAFIRQQALLRACWSLLGAMLGMLAILAGYGLLHLSAPVLIAVLVVIARISGPASQIQTGLQQIAFSLPAWDAVTAMDRELAAAEAPPAADFEMPWPSGPVEVEKVAFRHPDAKPGEAALVDVSFTIAPGEMVGLTGSSGAGKTTLADLLCGLLAPQSGRIVVAGIRLTAETAPQWRNRMAYVAQDPVLFNESVRENLLWANPRDDAALRRALAVTGADRLVERLPQGLETIVGERGSLISGGERQRLALARALLRDPVLLILDEATNAIDIESEAKILASLRAAGPKLAILMIAHRPESLAYCDRVLALDGGRLTRTGRPARPANAARIGNFA